MNNEKEIKEIYDKASIIKDIRERKEIIDKYNMTGVLDRQSAINKILKLRQTDGQVAATTAARLAMSSVPFEQASNEGIIAELQMQVGILMTKLTDQPAEK